MMDSNKIFSTTVVVLVNHLNYGNHLGYDSLLNILQEARMRWLKSLCQHATEINIENDIGWMVREAHVIYHSEAHYGDELLIDLFISKNDRMSSFTLSYEVYNNTTSLALASASTDLVCFDFTKSKPSRIPNLLLTSLQS